MKIGKIRAVSSPGKQLKALLSIHDVMPETLTRTQSILEFLINHGIKTVTLLIVPGRNWSSKDIDKLVELQWAGYILAGHGWYHGCALPKTIYHKLHSGLLSRMVAEQLSISRAEIIQIINRCYSWFVKHDLIPPDLYVPPTWAMGSISPKELDRLPFRLYETLTGLYDNRDHCFYRLPLIGFEADTNLRVKLLRILNKCNRGLAYLLNRPLRISIHPYDQQLGLASELEELLLSNYEYNNYTDINYLTTK